MESLILQIDDESTFEVKIGKSFNKGRDDRVLSRSIKELGFGRSIVVNAQNEIVCGHHTLMNALHKKDLRVKVIETNGEELVIVKRLDIQSGSKKHHELKLIDNLSNTRNICYDDGVILEQMAKCFAFDARDWGAHDCITRELNIHDIIKDGVTEKPMPKEKKDCGLEKKQMTIFDFDE